MNVNIKALIDDEQCCDAVRRLRWPERRECPLCGSPKTVIRGFNDKEPARRRYKCRECDKRFDDLTGTIFAGYRQPLKVWILCLYFMELNLSSSQISKELGLNRGDVHNTASQLREGAVKKSLR